MNVGAVALVTGGALLMHAALTAQSPLADLQSIFASGKVSSITDSLAGVRGTDPTGSKVNLQNSLTNLNHVTPSGTVH